MPAIFKFTDPGVFRVVKYKVFQSSPPDAMFVVWISVNDAAAPLTFAPRMYMPPEPMQ